MPPVGAKMNDEEIGNIIVYIKGWWTEEQKEFQEGDIGESYVNPTISFYK